jgi:hypothetical protein
MATKFYKPNARESALLLRRAIEERGERRFRALERRGERGGKPMTRARVSATTLKRLWNREKLTQYWLDEVNEWLLTAGWILVDAGATFGVVKTGVVQNWPRLASKHLETELEQVRRGKFDFGQLDSLLEEDEVISKEDKTSTPASEEDEAGSNDGKKSEDD